MSESMKQENLEVTQSETRTCGFSNYSVCQCGITNMDDDTCIWLRGKIPDEMLHLVKGVIG